MNRARFIRKAAGLAAAVTASALVLSGCGTAAAGGSTELSDEPVTLTMTWWGNDTRTANTQKIIDAFEAENPNITIEPSYTDWAGYWDKLATETAAGTTPDIIQMDEKYIATYAGRGALYDLSTLGDAIDTSNFDEGAVDSGKVGEGLYGISAGIGSYAIVANPAIFAQAGVEMPDDTTWTWDDFNEIAKKISDAGAGAYYGTQAWGFEDGGLRMWARQKGDEFYSTDGEVTIKPETLTSFWQQVLDLQEEGAAPPASGTVEKQTAGLSESYTATNQAAMGNWWNSQLTALSAASGSELKLLQLPDAAKTDAYWYKPSMYWSASSKTEHPAEAALFIDYLVNNNDAADIQLTERGVSANSEVRDHLEPQLSETDKAVVAFIDTITVGDAEPVTPAGGSAVEALIGQYTQQVLFGQATPAEAAEGFIKDLKAEVAAAS